MMEFPSRLSRMKLLSVNMKNFVSGESMVEKGSKESTSIFADLFKIDKGTVFKLRTTDVVRNVPKILMDTH